MAKRDFSRKSDAELLVGTPLEESALMRRLRARHYAEEHAEEEERTYQLPGGGKITVRHREPGSSDKRSKP
ncbi:MAG: hypothetical protein ACRD2F_02455 [Terriglobales bacterium]